MRQGFLDRQSVHAGRTTRRSREFQWLVDAARGLGAIHAAGLVHRDVKPANILIGPGGRAVVVDLGIARGFDAGEAALTATGLVPGTFAYMAPEQLTSPGSVDARADLFSLGVTFYELLTGSLPAGSWRPASEINPTVPAPFDAVLERLLRPRPGDRYPDAGTLIGACAVPSAPRRTPTRGSRADVGPRGTARFRPGTGGIDPRVGRRPRRTGRGCGLHRPRRRPDGAPPWRVGRRVAIGPRIHARPRRTGRRRLPRGPGRRRGGDRGGRDDLPDRERSRQGRGRCRPGQVVASRGRPAHGVDIRARARAGPGRAWREIEGQGRRRETCSSGRSEEGRTLLVRPDDSIRDRRGAPETLRARGDAGVGPSQHFRPPSLRFPSRDRPGAETSFRAARHRRHPQSIRAAARRDASVAREEIARSRRTGTAPRRGTEARAFDLTAHPVKHTPPWRSAPRSPAGLRRAPSAIRVGDRSRSGAFVGVADSSRDRGRPVGRPDRRVRVAPNPRSRTDMPARSRPAIVALAPSRRFARLVAVHDDLGAATAGPSARTGRGRTGRDGHGPRSRRQAQVPAAAAISRPLGAACVPSVSAVHGTRDTPPIVPLYRVPVVDLGAGGVYAAARGGRRTPPPRAAETGLAPVDSRSDHSAPRDRRHT